MGTLYQLRENLSSGIRFTPYIEGSGSFYVCSLWNIYFKGGKALHTITITRQRTTRFWSKKKGDFVRVPTQCSLCGKRLMEGMRALRTSTRYYCLDCEKILFVETEDVTDEELENFFSEEQT